MLDLAHSVHQTRINEPFGEGKLPDDLSVIFGARHVWLDLYLTIQA